VFATRLEFHDAPVPSQKPKPCLARIQFGRNVAKLRHRAKLTQERLAEHAGVSARYVQSLEAGEYFPALPTLLKLKTALDAKWDDLFRGCEK
jgi:transcriptional regulator with XRE-family HTH domain